MEVQKGPFGGIDGIDGRVSPGFIPGLAQFHSGCRPVSFRVSPGLASPQKNAQFDQKALVRTSSDPEQLKERQRRLEEAGAFRAPTNAARLPAPVRGGAGRGVLRCDDGAGHRWLGDPVEARLAGASRVRGA